jgi:hypothetical protein
MGLFTFGRSLLVALVAVEQCCHQPGLPCLGNASNASQELAKDHFSLVTSGSRRLLGLSSKWKSRLVCILHS